MFVKRELALGGYEMIVPDADVVDVSWHGKVAQAFRVNWAVVPFEPHAGKAGAVDFLRDFVVLFESLAKITRWASPTYWMAKLSTMSANMTGHHLWHRIPGMVAAS